MAATSSTSISRARLVDMASFSLKSQGSLCRVETATLKLCYLLRYAALADLFSSFKCACVRAVHDVSFSGCRTLRYLKCCTL